MPIFNFFDVPSVPHARLTLIAATLTLTMHLPQLAPVCLGSAVCLQSPIHGHDDHDDASEQRPREAHPAATAFVTGSLMVR